LIKCVTFSVKTIKLLEIKKLLEALLRESFESLKIKRQKLKTGSIKFSLKNFSYNGIIISQ
jgi:hypothetical protein